MAANNLFTFESFNQERLFEVDATDFVKHERKNSKGKIEESTYWKTAEMYELGWSLMRLSDASVPDTRGVQLRSIPINLAPTTSWFGRPSNCWLTNTLY